jgi:FixJ family two-component response regulator
MLKVFVIDSAAARRAQVCRLLMDCRIHSEPFETVAEFAEHMPSQGLVLYCDERGDMAQLVEALEQRSWLPVIAYAHQPDIQRVVRAMQAGAASYVGFPIDPAEIMAEYGKLQGSFAARLAQRERASTARRRLDTLSNRERQVLGCMLDYGTSKEIARFLGISPRTVEAHRANLMVRLDVRTATQAIRVAVEGGACGATQAFASPSGRRREGGNSPAPAPVLQ